MRSIYTWSGGKLQRVGAVSEPHLRAWEYELASDQAWPAAEGDADDTVRLWRTRRPDLAPPELWVGDCEG
ncbi:MAG TPA: hypothetical protein VKB93_18245 [Thermoanaerobaculia bacterium]|nr:hypothetical protein [Thermoanaerobaculia bacterium]